MAELPAFPLWTDAYLADTGHLTTLEHGTYLLLLMTMWRNGGSLPNDDKKLARFARLSAGQWKRIRPTIMEFFRVENNQLFQNRLTDELTYVRQKRKTQQDNARSKWRKIKEQGDPVGPFRESQTDAPTPTPTPTPKEDTPESPQGGLSDQEIPDDPDLHIPKQTNDWPPKAFEKFYDLYPHKVGRLAAEKKFEQIRLSKNPPTWADLIAGLNRYIAKTDDRPWCNPSTWLNQGRWADEPANNTPTADTSRTARREAALDFVFGANGSGLGADQGTGDNGFQGPADNLAGPEGTGDSGSGKPTQSSFARRFESDNVVDVGVAPFTARR